MAEKPLNLKPSPLTQNLASDATMEDFAREIVASAQKDGLPIHTEFRHAVEPESFSAAYQDQPLEDAGLRMEKDGFVLVLDRGTKSGDARHGTVVSAIADRAADQFAGKDIPVLFVNESAFASEKPVRQRLEDALVAEKGPLFDQDSTLQQKYQEKYDAVMAEREKQLEERQTITSPKALYEHDLKDQGRTGRTLEWALDQFGYNESLQSEYASKYDNYREAQAGSDAFYASFDSPKTLYEQELRESIGADQVTERDYSKGLKTILRDPNLLVVASSTYVHQNKPLTQDALALIRESQALHVLPAGNDGEILDVQIDDALYHEGLVVTIGWADAHPDGSVTMHGQSTANGPAFAMPVPEEAQVKWDGKNLSPAAGTSAAVPDFAGKMAAVIQEYGDYLPTEQILYAAMVTSDPVHQADAYTRTFQKRSPWGDDLGTATVSFTPEDVTLEHITNDAGMAYDPARSGFGVPNFDRLETLLPHMVEHAQQHPETVSQSVRQQQSLTPTRHTQENGLYRYTLTMGEGTALKQTLELEYIPQSGDFDAGHARGLGDNDEIEDRGQVFLVSPSGVKVELFPSQRGDLSAERQAGATSAPSGKATTYAFAGSDLAGEWHVLTTHPLSELSLEGKHLATHDMVRQFTKEKINALETQPTPDLSKAVSFTEKEVAQEYADWLDFIKEGGLHEARPPQQPQQNKPEQQKLGNILQQENLPDGLGLHTIGVQLGNESSQNIGMHNTKSNAEIER